MWSAPSSLPVFPKLDESEGGEQEGEESFPETKDFDSPSILRCCDGKPYDLLKNKQQESSPSWFLLTRESLFFFFFFGFDFVFNNKDMARNHYVLIQALFITGFYSLDDFSIIPSRWKALDLHQLLPPRISASGRPRLRGSDNGSECCVGAA